MMAIPFRPLVSGVPALLAAWGLLVGAESAPSDSVRTIPASAGMAIAADSSRGGGRPDSIRPGAPCRLPVRLSLASDVLDPVLSILLGLVETDACGVLTRSRLEREVRMSGRPSRIPVPYLHVIRRSYRQDGPRAEITLFSVSDLDLPVPYEILNYHPGRVRVSEVVLLEEWKLGRVRLDGGPDSPPIVLEDVVVWGLRRGRVEMDVDAWLDSMLGSKLDDMRLGGFALFRYQGERIGLALGYGPDGTGRSGALSLREDKVLFPAPPALKRAGAHLRGRLEQLMPSLLALRRPVS